MTSCPTFVSFSSADWRLVARLIDRLRGLGFGVWDYSTEGEEIPGGVEIGSFLEQKIARSRLFVPVIGPHSLAAPFVAREVACALSLRQRGELTVIPLVMPGCPRTWLAPFSALAGLRHYEVDPGHWLSLEEAVRRLCGDLGQPYVRPLLDDPRLPFLAAFDRELDARTESAQEGGASARYARHPEREVATHARLMQIRNEVVEAIGDGDYAKAAELMSHFIGICRYEYELPDRPLFYYPRVVQAVCQIAAGQLAPAMAALEGLLAHPDCEENVYGAIGYIKHTQGAYLEALYYYQRAARLKPDDPAARYGVLLNALLGGAEVDVAALLKTLDEATVPMPSDRIRLREIKALALVVRLGRVDEALQLYQQLVAAGEVTADTIINFARALSANRRQADAVRLLEQHRQAFADDPAYLHQLATSWFQTRQWNQAVAGFAELARRYPRQRQYLIDAALAHRWVGENEAARRIAAQVFDREQLPVPASARDFWLDGFANYLLGRSERAGYDFWRSGYGEDLEYRRLMPPGDQG